MTDEERRKLEEELEKMVLDLLKLNDPEIIGIQSENRAGLLEIEGKVKT